MLAALESVESLIVRCPNWVGDIVMATPVFECLRSNFPQAEITALIRPYARGIIENSPWINRVVDCDDNSLTGLRKIRRALKSNKPQAGLLLTNTTHSFLTFKFAGIKQVYGYRRNFRKHFLTGGPEPERAGKFYKPMPMQDYYLQLCQFLGLRLPARIRPQLHIDTQLQYRGEQRLQHYGIKVTDRVIGLNPGASFGSSKCWPAAHFARLAELLQQQFHCKIILFVGPGEERIAASICEKSKAQIINTAADMIDLAELKPLIRRCNLLITNDTGPRHFAVAFAVPNIVLMGPTNPLYTAAHLQNTTVPMSGILPFLVEPLRSA